MAAIGRVSDVISQINENQNAIAGAVEEQTAVTSEISRNIAEVAIGSGEIARSVSMVAETAHSTTGGSDLTLKTAFDIESMAAELMALVDQSVPVIGRDGTGQSSGSERRKYVVSDARETVFAE